MAYPLSIKPGWTVNRLMLMLSACFLVWPSNAQAAEAIRSVDPDMARMGRIVFFDARFSASGKKSCSSCHQPAFAFSDDQPFSERDNGLKTRESTPALFDLERKLGFFSREPVFSLEDAIQRCMEDNLGTSVMQAYVTLKKDRSLSQFSVAATGRVSAGALYEALRHYLYSLRSAESRYDRYLQGNRQALTLSEQQGMQLFEQKGCHYCHSGRGMGGTVYAPAADEDRAGDVQVPRLRHLSRTAPYFSDGSASSLGTAVSHMARAYNKTRITDAEMELIRIFLLSNDSSIHDFEGPVLYETIR